LRFDGTPPYVILLVHPAFLSKTLSQFRDCSGEELNRAINGIAYEHKRQAPVLNELVFRLSKVRGWLQKDAADNNPVATAIGDMQILLDIIGRLFTAESAPRLEVRENTPVKRAIAAVEQHFQNPLTLDTIARDASTSKYHLCRLFKVQTGTSLWTYVNSVRIRNAVSLLAQGEKNVTEVCFECGFTDPSYFAKVFRRHIGVNPKKWGTRIPGASPIRVP
jgi:AraC-like DNA-binding protein